MMQSSLPTYMCTITDEPMNAHTTKACTCTHTHTHTHTHKTHTQETHLASIIVVFHLPSFSWFNKWAPIGTRGQPAIFTFSARLPWSIQDTLLCVNPVLHQGIWRDTTVDTVIAAVEELLGDRSWANQVLTTRDKRRANLEADLFVDAEFI